MIFLFFYYKISKMDYRIRKLAENIKKSQFFNGSLRTDECMANHTTMKVGGNAAIFAEPCDVSSMAFVAANCSAENLPFFVLGGGSNLIVSDEGFPGAIISTEKLNFITRKENSVECGAGCLTNDAVNFFAENGLSGMENFAGLPGTVGGACFMNARCYSKEFSEMVESTEYFDAEKTGFAGPNFLEEGVKIYHNVDNSGWAYKKSPFSEKRCVITKVTFRAEKTGVPSDELRQKCSEFISDREAKGHFRLPSSGSVFKNNRAFGVPSGKLIDEAGLKGAKIGGAQIAPWHGNIIVNTGNATCSDIKRLVGLVQRKVKERTGFFLECEVIFL